MLSNSLHLGDERNRQGLHFLRLMMGDVSRPNNEVSDVSSEIHIESADAPSSAFVKPAAIPRVYQEVSDVSSEVYIEPADAPSAAFIKPAVIPSVHQVETTEESLNGIEPALHEFRGKICHVFWGEAYFLKIAHLLECDSKKQQEFMLNIAKKIADEQSSNLRCSETSSIILDFDFPINVQSLERQMAKFMGPDQGFSVDDIIGYDGNLTAEDILELQEINAEHQKYNDELQKYESGEYAGETEKFNELKKWYDDLAKRDFKLERKQTLRRESLRRDTFTVFKSLVHRFRKDLIRMITAELEEMGLDKKVGIMGEFYGHGGIGEVHSLRIGEKDFAIKIHYGDIGLDYNRYEELREATENCEHLVRFFGTTILESDNKLFGFKGKKANKTRIDLFEELKGTQSLSDYLCSKNLNIRNSAEYSEDFIFFMNSIFIPVLKGVKALHDRGLAHLDLKPQNIFVQSKDDKLNVKVGDYDSIRDPQNYSCRNLAVTPTYMSPEYANGYITCKSDIYSLGIMLYYLLRKNKTKEDINPELLAPDGVIELIKECVNEDIDKRPSIDELIARVNVLIATAKEQLRIKNAATEAGDTNIEETIYEPEDEEIINSETDEHRGQIGASVGSDALDVRLEMQVLAKASEIVGGNAAIEILDPPAGTDKPETESIPLIPHDNVPPLVTTPESEPAPAVTPANIIHNVPIGEIHGEINEEAPHVTPKESDAPPVIVDDCLNDENINADAFYRLLDNGEYEKAIDCRIQNRLALNIEEWEICNQKIRKCVENCILNSDFKNAKLLRVNLGKGIDFTTDDELSINLWLNNNNKKSIADFFKYFPDETKQVFYSFLEEGWLYFSDKLHTALKDKDGWASESECRYWAEQGVLRTLEKGDLDTALSLHRNYINRELWNDPERIEFAKIGFYNCLISGNMKNALKLWAKFTRSTDLTATLKHAYSYCIDHFLTDTAREIYNEFSNKADFSRF